MDEPLASLDEARRAEILPYIERLRDEAGLPILYVSHSVAEVARLATTVVILTDGQVTAVGPVADILSQAEAGDGGSVLEATVARHDEAFQLSVLASAAGELQVPRLSAPVGAAVRAYIRARDVMLSLQPPEEISALNVLAGRVAAITPSAGGAQADVRLDCNGASLTARLTAKSVQRLALAPGRPVYAVIKSVSFERSRSGECDGSDAMPHLSIRIDFDQEGRLGPGKVALLERIASEGSISAAGRSMNMSYKRAWELVAEINQQLHRAAGLGPDRRQDRRRRGADAARRWS